jgi:hypothetical protein
MRLSASEVLFRAPGDLEAPDGGVELRAPPLRGGNCAVDQRHVIGGTLAPRNPADNTPLLGSRLVRNLRSFIPAFGRGWFRRHSYRAGEVRLPPFPCLRDRFFGSRRSDFGEGRRELFLRFLDDDHVFRARDVPTFGDSERRAGGRRQLRVLR